MSKVTISPLLNSLFRTSDNITKDEANRLVAGLSEVGGENVRISLAQSTLSQNGKSNYLIVQGEDNGDSELEVIEILEDSGWNVTRSWDKGNEGFWMFFNRQ